MIFCAGTQLAAAGTDVPPSVGYEAAHRRCIDDPDEWQNMELPGEWAGIPVLMVVLVLAL